MKKDFIMLGFWFLALLMVILYARFAYGEIMKPEVVYDKETNIIDEILPPETVKEQVVSQVQHEELKGPKYTIKVGLGGARKPIPKITGSTVDERAKEWLDTAGLGWTLDTWIQHGGTYKVDYVLPICIAWADSHLGKALKSTNNIGNVGNRDDGSVIHFATLSDGIMAIYRTLNNRWIGGSTKLGQLSGEGRIILGVEDCNGTKVNQKCYATSKVVWHTNVSNCMSVIHNKSITENYEFRR